MGPQVVLKREWSREPDLPAISPVEKNVDPVLAKPPTEDQIIRLRFVDQLIKYTKKNGQNIGSHFRWLPCEARIIMQSHPPDFNILSQCNLIQMYTVYLEACLAWSLSAASKSN